MSDRTEAFTHAAEQLLAETCRFLGRELPPPAGWRATELRTDDGLSVYEVQAGGGIDPADVGQWAIGAGPTPRDESRFANREDAAAEAETLDRLEDEARA